MNELNLMLNDFETFYMERGSPSIRKYHKRKLRDFRLVYVVSWWEAGKRPSPVILLPAVVSRLIMMN